MSLGLHFVALAQPRADIGRNKRYARASKVVLWQIGSSEYIPRGRLAAHVEDSVDPWSERKGRVGVAWWSARTTGAQRVPPRLPITPCLPLSHL